MKKILSCFILLTFILLSNKVVRADHYLNFQELNIPHGKLIDDYSDNDLKKYYKEVDKRKFAGWRVKKINNRVKCSFISETVFSYYNDGTSSIDYNYKSEETKSDKYSFSSTGSISTKISGDIKGFKGGLDASLKMSYSDEKQSSKKEVYEIKMKMDPKTQTTLYYYGEGYLTNGVSSNYVFWIRVNRGGFEVFEVATKYYRMEKTKL